MSIAYDRPCLTRQVRLGNRVVIVSGHVAGSLLDGGWVNYVASEAERGAGNFRLIVFGWERSIDAELSTRLMMRLSLPPRGSGLRGASIRDQCVAVGLPPLVFDSFVNNSSNT